MKHIIFLLFGILSFQISLAQDCYQTFLNEGIKAYNDLNFEQAINQFKAAEICDDLPLNNEVKDWVDKAQNGYIDAIKKERTKARSLALTAKSIIELKKNDDATKAFRYAQYAWEKEDTPESRLALYDCFYQLDTKENRKHFYIRDVEVFKDINSRIRTIGFIDHGQTIYVSEEVGNELLLFDFEGTKIAELSAEVHWYTDQAYCEQTGLLLVTEKSKKKHFVKGYHLKDSKISKQAAFQYASTGGDISAIAVSRDGERIATCFNKGEVHILNKEGKFLYQLPKAKRAAKYLSFAHDHHLALAYDNVVKVFKLGSKNADLIFEREEEGYFNANITLSSKASFLMTVFSRKINIWDIKGDSLYASSNNMGYQLDVGMFSSDELYATFGNQFLHLKDKRKVNTFPAEVRNMKFSADKKYLATNIGGIVARLWEDQVYGLVEDHGTLAGHKDFIVQLNFSPDSIHLVTGSDDRTFKIWNPRINATSRVRNAGRVLMNTELEDRIVIGAADKNELNFFYENGAFREYHGLPVENIVAISSDAKYVFANVSNGFEVWTLDLNAKSVNFHNGISGVDSSVIAQFSTDDRVAFYTRENNNLLRIWNMEKGKTSILAGYDTDLIEVKWSPDNKHLIALDNFGKLYLWNVEGKSKLIKSWAPHSGNGCYNMNFSKDGKKIVTCGHDNIATVWDLEGNQLTRLLGHIRMIYDADFSKDGKFIVTASKDRTLKIWTIEGEQIITIKDFEYPLSQVAFSVDGKYIIASYGIQGEGYKENYTKIYPFDPQLIIDYLESYNLPDLSEKEKSKYGVE